MPRDHLGLGLFSIFRESYWNKEGLINLQHVECCGQKASWSVGEKNLNQSFAEIPSFSYTRVSSHAHQINTRNKWMLCKSNRVAKAPQSTPFFRYALLDERQLRHRDTERDRHTTERLPEFCSRSCWEGPGKLPWCCESVRCWDAWSWWQCSNTPWGSRRLSSAAAASTHPRPQPQPGPAGWAGDRGRASGWRCAVGGHAGSLCPAAVRAPPPPHAGRARPGSGAVFAWRSERGRRAPREDAAEKGAGPGGTERERLEPAL